MLRPKIQVLVAGLTDAEHCMSFVVPSLCQLVPAKAPLERTGLLCTSHAGSALVRWGAAPTPAAARLARQRDEVIVSARSAAKARKAVREHPAAQEGLERVVDERGYAARGTGRDGKRHTLLRHERVQRRRGGVARLMDQRRR
jgi:hypothetical protein